jgi:hypothetical protein
LDLGAKKSAESKEPLSKNYTKLTELGNKTSKPEKKSYLDNVTENDIEKDKEAQRYNILMKKLNQVSLEKEKSKSKQSTAAATSKTLNPLSTKSSLNSHPEAMKSPKSTESQAKNDNYVESKQNGSSQNKNEQSDSDDDEDDDRAAAIKAPNELLEEVIYIFSK